MTKMLRANLINPQEFRLEEVERPVPGPGEVLIDVKLCGICGSDIHAYHGVHAFIHCPIVLGHEFVGDVAAVGPDVTEFSPGQKVVVEPNLVCGECYNCRNGRYNVCLNLKVIGCQDTGAYAQSIVVPTDKVLPVPEDLSYDRAVLVEPLAVGVHAIHRSGMKAGDRVVIFGVGPIGLLTLVAAKSMGAGKVLAVDVIDSRLELAQRFGADTVCNSTRDNLEEVIVREFGPERADLHFECSAAPQALNQAIDLARKGLTIVQVGCFGPPVTINNLSYVQENELSIIGTKMNMKSKYQEAIDMLYSADLPFEELITHRFPLQDVAKAFQMLDEEKERVIKAVLEIG